MDDEMVTGALASDADFPSVGALLRQIADLAHDADDMGITDQAAALVELQRVSAWALRLAVGQARDDGVSWRDLAVPLEMPVATLHRQYQAGRPLLAPMHGDEPGAVPRGGGVPDLRPGSDEPEVRRRGGVPIAGRDVFVGRERELTELPRLLAQHRVVTVTGPGGVGKTRLVVEALPAMRPVERARVWWVELAPVARGARIPGAVAQAARVRPKRNEDTLDAVVRAAADAAVLLVLDNCEHLVDDCAALVEYLHGECPRLRVAATSREALRVPGEARMPLGPLALPASGPGAMDAVRSVDAVRLYVERARMVAPGFEATDDILPLIAQVCTRLDGLPLALELAAHQAGLLGPARLLERMHEGLTVLTGGARHAPRRHHSMYAAIAWSYELLDKHQQAVFRRLCVLPGGFDDAGAAALCADLGLPADQLRQVITALAAKSLVRPDPADSERLRIFESLREFGRGELAAAGELADTDGRLIGWLAAMASPILTVVTVDEQLWVQLDRERHNLEYAAGVADVAADPHHPVLALALALCQQWAGELAAAQAGLERLLAAHTAADLTRAAALINLSTAMGARGDYRTAERHATAGVALAHELDHHALTVRGLGALANAHYGLGQPGDALRYERQRIELLRQLGHTQALAEASTALAWGLLELDRFDEAADALAEALPVLESGSDPTALGPALHTAGTLALLRHDTAQARVFFTMALRLPARDPEHIPYNLDGLALVAARYGDHERCQRLLAAADTERERTDTSSDTWWQQFRQTAAGTAVAAGLTDTAYAGGAALTVDQAIDYALSSSPPSPQAPPQQLSPREHDVAELVAQGLTGAQIATQLGISSRTVASHLKHIRIKLDAPTRAHLIAWVLRHSEP